MANSNTAAHPLFHAIAAGRALARSSPWRDYLMGAGMAFDIAPPVPPHKTFIRNDRAALAADCEALARDRMLVITKITHTQATVTKREAPVVSEHGQATKIKAAG